VSVLLQFAVIVLTEFASPAAVLAVVHNDGAVAHESRLHPSVLLQG